MNRIIFHIKFHFMTKWITCNRIGEKGQRCRKNKNNGGYIWMCDDCTQKVMKIAKKHDVKILFDGEENE